MLKRWSRAAGFHAILESQDDIEVAGEAAGGREAVDLARKPRRDVVLMDIRVPALDILVKRLVDAFVRRPPPGMRVPAEVAGVSEREPKC